MAIYENNNSNTPIGIVTLILDSVRYTGKSILSKKIIDPAFGKGDFLVEIVNRIIHEGTKASMTHETIKDIIERYVYGFERDMNLYSNAIQRLNNLLTSYDISIPSWSNLKCSDALLSYEEYIGTMDICVNDPPFFCDNGVIVDYPNVAKRFKYIDNNSDLYMLFYGIGIQMLKEDCGRLSYITPISFLRNASQREFRDYLVKATYLSAIYDFSDSKINNDDKHMCICVVDKNKERINKKVIEYRVYNMFKLIKELNIGQDKFKDIIKQSTWNLNSEDELQYLHDNSKRPIKIRSIAAVQNGIATNCDNVFIGKAWLDENKTVPYEGKHTDAEQLVWFNGSQVESTVLRRCVKASDFYGTITNTYILFPYTNKSKNKLLKESDGSKVDTKYAAYTEPEMKKKYPKAYGYLSANWQELETRNMDSNSDWFVFGNNQGLANSGYRKIVFKHVISRSSNHIDAYIVDEDVIVYSGLYITPDTSAFIFTENTRSVFNDNLYNEKLEEIKSILTSQDFHRYCILVGKDLRENEVSVSSDYVKNYGTMLTQFPGVPVVIPDNDISIADSDYMNRLFTMKFLECIKESYINMAKFGTTSTERVKPFHSFLARVLKFKLGQDYDVVADGYSFGKEIGIEGNFDSKNVDVCVMKDEVVLGAIAFKLLSNNFKQNYKNFSEGMLGETAQMKGIGIPYAFCYLIPERALYREDVNKKTGIGKYMKTDALTQNDAKIYYDIANDADYKNRTPDAMFLGIHKLFSEDYLTSLKVGDTINVSSDDYLNGIQPEWSDLSFIKDEDIRLFYEEQLNLGEFLDRFIEKMGINID